MPSNNPYILRQKKKGAPLFIPFAVLGDPNPGGSLQVIQALIESGADALELGLPFSDPPADGPVIQAADVRALTSGTTMDDCFVILKKVRAMTDIPVSLLVYSNLVFQRGVEKFYADAAASGVTSVLVADLPLEHSEEIVPFARKHGIHPVFLVSELTTEARLNKIVKFADGYLYVVSYLGVTGVESAVFEGLVQKTLKKLKAGTSLPLFVGFGVSSPTQAEAIVRAGADGVIVGSRIVREVPDLKNIRQVCDVFATALRTKNSPK